MNDKTKRKIEAMLPKEGLQVHQQFECGEHNGILKGATPWAEWCERLEQQLKLWDESGFKRRFPHHRSLWFATEQLLKEHRQWLEGVK